MVAEQSGSSRGGGSGLGSVMGPAVTSSGGSAVPGASLPPVLWLGALSLLSTLLLGLRGNQSSRGSG